jgi:hypothetical protein
MVLDASKHARRNTESRANATARAHMRGVTAERGEKGGKNNELESGAVRFISPHCARPLSLHGSPAVAYNYMAFLAWSRVVSNLFKHATLARRTWQEFPTPSGGSNYHLYCDPRAASGLFSAVCRSVAESAGGAKVLAYTTDALPLLPRGLRHPTGA